MSYEYMDIVKDV